MKMGFFDSHRQLPEHGATRAGGGRGGNCQCHLPSDPPHCTALEGWNLQLEQRDCITQPGSNPSPCRKPAPAELPARPPPAPAAGTRLRAAVITEYILFTEFYK